MKKEKRYRNDTSSAGWDDPAPHKGVRGRFIERRQNWHDYLDAETDDDDVDFIEGASDDTPDEEDEPAERHERANSAGNTAGS